MIGIGNCKIIHVNLDEGVLEGDIKIQADIKEFIEMIMDVKIKPNENWLSNVQKHSSIFPC